MGQNPFDAVHEVAWSLNWSIFISFWFLVRIQLSPPSILSLWDPQVSTYFRLFFNPLIYNWFDLPINIKSGFSRKLLIRPWLLNNWWVKWKFLRRWFRILRILRNDILWGIFYIFIKKSNKNSINLLVILKRQFICLNKQIKKFKLILVIFKLWLQTHT